MVGGHAIGAEEREVFDVIGGFDLHAIDRVSEADLLVGAAGDTEAKGERLSGCGPAVAFGTGEFSHSGIKQPGLIGAGFFSVAGVGGSEISVRQALLKDGVGNLAVQGEAFGLLVFFIPSKIEPAQAFEDGVHGSVGVALDIGVVEAQDHGSVVVLGVEPVEDERAGTANVQKTGGGRRKSNTKHNF